MSTDTTYWAGLPVAVGKIEQVSAPIGFGTVEGTVTAPGGAGIADAVVSIGGLSTKTSSQGRFTLADVPEGSRVVSFTADGYVGKQLTVNIAANKTTYANMQLAPVPITVGAIEGTVTAQGGGAIAGALVSIDATSTNTSPLGRFNFAGIPAGIHAVTVSADGYFSKVITVTVEAGATSYANVVLAGVPAPPPPPDTSAPVTYVEGVPEGWVNHDVRLSLHASDESGIAGTYYRIDDDASVRYSEEVTVSAEGTTTMSYWSEDNAGNHEAAKTVSVRIDKTKPSLDLDVAGDGTTSVTVSANAADALSGLSVVEARVDSGSSSATSSVNLKTLGTHTVTFVAKDAAGNEAEKTVTVAVQCQTIQSVLTRSALVKYGSRLVLTGTLSNASGLSLAGQQVALERYVSGKWIETPMATASVDASGAFSFAMRPSEKAVYRFVFLGTAQALPSVSTTISVSVAASVPMPRAAVSHRRLTISGRISPAHSGGATIYYERKVRGHYRAYATRYASVTSKGTYSRVMSLPRGSWRVRVKHEDSMHAKTYSSWRYVTIR